VLATGSGFGFVADRHAPLRDEFMVLIGPRTTVREQSIVVQFESQYWTSKGPPDRVVVQREVRSNRGPMEGSRRDLQQPLSAVVNAAWPPNQALAADGRRPPVCGVAAAPRSWSGDGAAA